MHYTSLMTQNNNCSWFTTVCEGMSYSNICSKCLCRPTAHVSWWMEDVNTRLQLGRIFPTFRDARKANSQPVMDRLSPSSKRYVRLVLYSQQICSNCSGYFKQYAMKVSLWCVWYWDYQWKLRPILIVIFCVPAFAIAYLPTQPRMHMLSVTQRRRPSMVRWVRSCFP